MDADEIDERRKSLARAGPTRRFVLEGANRKVVRQRYSRFLSRIFLGLVFVAR